MSQEIFPSDLNLEEISSSTAEGFVFYQILKMDGLYYIWIGTDRGQLGNLVAAYCPRTGGDPAISSLLGPSGDSRSSKLAERLQKRIGKHLIVSVNLPDDNLLLHAEQFLVEHLTDDAGG